ncbi:MAG: hypothetical protein IAF58_19510 [Leptolyngbya sp.]|nr:hypothetical protein [Candidatus Melainabacteria bacterium]
MHSSFSIESIQKLPEPKAFLRRDLLLTVKTSATAGTKLPGMQVVVDENGVILGGEYADGTNVILGINDRGHKFSMVSSPDGSFWLLVHSGAIFCLD